MLSAVPDSEAYRSPTKPNTSGKTGAKPAPSKKTAVPAAARLCVVTRINELTSARPRLTNNTRVPDMFCRTTPSTSRVTISPSQKSARYIGARSAATLSSSANRIDTHPPTVDSIPLSRNSITPMSRSTGSRSRRRACATGKPWGCFSGGKVEIAESIRGSSTNAGMNARMADVENVPARLESTNGTPTAPTPKNAPTNVSAAPRRSPPRAHSQRRSPARR